MELFRTAATKRQVLQLSSRIFDPLDHLAPVVVVIKQLFQAVWAANINWDDPVPAHIHEQWKEVLEGLRYLEGFKIPRCVLLDAPSAANAELHVYGEGVRGSSLPPQH